MSALACRLAAALLEGLRDGLCESAEWDEQKHPRADDGKFGSGSGGGGGGKAETRKAADAYRKARDAATPALWAKVGDAEGLYNQLSNNILDAGIPRMLGDESGPLLDKMTATRKALARSGDATPEERIAAVRDLRTVLQGHAEALQDRIDPDTPRLSHEPLAQMRTLRTAAAKALAVEKHLQGALDEYTAAVGPAAKAYKKAKGGARPTRESADFDPSKHPRADDGKFGHGSGGGKGVYHEAAVAKFKDALAAHKGLPPEKAAHYAESAGAVIGKMSPKAAERFAAHAKSYLFHESSEALTAALAKRYESVAKLKARGGSVGGSFNNVSGELNLDGGHATTKLATAAVYAHEFGHALDGLAGDRISEKPEWTEAWRKEMCYTRRPELSYAETSRVEGFAEFARFVHTSDMTPEQLEKQFPRCVAVWKKEGLL